MSALFGLLNVNKPAGVSSRKVVDRVVAAVQPAKAGHAGTLDPMAAGVLVVCVGRATRLIQYVQRQQKTYAATFLLGCRSDTDDITSEVTEVSINQPPSQEQVEAALSEFAGQIEQVPPRFSAVHVNGRRAYQLARKGKDVELTPRSVEVHRIELTRYAFPEIDLIIECGSGTYIRAIGRDLGNALGCGAVMSGLERTAIGPFQIADAVDLEAITPDTVSDHLLPTVKAVADLPQVDCTAEEVAALHHGRRIPARESFSNGEEIALLTPDGDLAAIAETIDNEFAPRQVFC